MGTPRAIMQRNLAVRRTRSVTSTVHSRGAPAGTAPRSSAARRSASLSYPVNMTWGFAFFALDDVRFWDPPVAVVSCCCVVEEAAEACGDDRTRNLKKKNVCQSR